MSVRRALKLVCVVGAMTFSRSVAADDQNAMGVTLFGTGAGGVGYHQELGESVRPMQEVDLGASFDTGSWYRLGLSLGLFRSRGPFRWCRVETCDEVRFLYLGGEVLLGVDIGQLVLAELGGGYHRESIKFFMKYPVRSEVYGPDGSRFVLSQSIRVWVGPAFASFRHLGGSEEEFLFILEDAEESMDNAHSWYLGIGVGIRYRLGDRSGFTWKP